jgi:peptidylprolyl isomerase
VLVVVLVVVANRLAIDVTICASRDGNPSSTSVIGTDSALLERVTGHRRRRRRDATRPVRRYPRSLVGTEKRERQKANRQQRLMEEARAERTNVVKRNAVRWIAGIIAAVGAVVLIAWVGGAFDSTEEQALPTLPPIDTTPIDTTPPVTFPVPPKPEVQIPDELPTELVVNYLVNGEGPEAAPGDIVEVHYVGVRSADGTEFDNSYDRGTTFPVTVGAGQVIAGWDQGLVGAQAGDRIQLDIPADLAYGDNPRGEVIQAGDALTFVIDVMSVTPSATS